VLARKIVALAEGPVRGQALLTGQLLIVLKPSVSIPELSLQGTKPLGVGE